MIRACTLLVLPFVVVALLAPSAAAGWKHRHHGGGGVHYPHQRSGQFVQFLREAAPIAGDILRIVLVQPEGGGQPPTGDGGGVAENPNAPASAGEQPVTLSTSTADFAQHEVEWCQRASADFAKLAEIRQLLGMPPAAVQPDPCPPSGGAPVSPADPAAPAEPGVPPPPVPGAPFIVPPRPPGQ